MKAFEQALPRAGLRVTGLYSPLSSASPSSQLKPAAKPSAPTRLLLLHGWPEWSQAWQPVMSRLAGQFEMLAPDLRGFGNTTPLVLQPSKDAGPAQHAADLLELATQRGWANFAVVAHDVGSFVAQAMARMAPQRLQGLFFFNCAHPGVGARWVKPSHVGELWYQFFHQLPWAAQLVGSSREACRLYFKHFLSHWSHQQAWIEPALEAWVDHFMQPGRLQGGFNWYSSVWEARLAVMEGRAPVLTPIDVPTRVLWGQHDPVLKAEWVDNLHLTFSQLKQVNVLPSAGHFVHLEQPDIAAHEIGAFFSALA